LNNNGQPEHVKPILLNHYNTPEQILALVGKGKLHILAESPKCPDSHTFENPVDGYCVYYGRDRKDGERFNLVYFFGSHDPISESYIGYQYLYDNEWLFKASGTDDYIKLIDLK